MKNAAFLEGMSSSTDLIDAELNLAGVRTERLQAAYNFDLLLAQLLEAAGISDEFRSTPAAPTHGRSCSKREGGRPSPPQKKI